MRRTERTPATAFARRGAVAAWAFGPEAVDDRSLCERLDRAALQTLPRPATTAETVERILVREWDPIGIRDEPFAQDEYRSYVAEVVRSAAAAGTGGGAALLRYVESVWMLELRETRELARRRAVSARQVAHVVRNDASLVAAESERLIAAIGRRRLVE